MLKRFFVHGCAHGNHHCGAFPVDDKRVSFWLNIFKIVSITKAFVTSSLLPTPLSETLLLNATTKLWSKVPEAYCTITPCLFNSRIRRSTLPSTFLIACLAARCMGRPRTPNGMDINMMWVIFEILVVCAMHIYPSFFSVNWIAKLVSVFS